MVKDKVSLDDTPDDRAKPPKSRSLSTPRRRSTHIRCLDFSTPQPKNNDRDQARSKLLFDTPKRCEKILEEPSPSPLPKLQADWGSVNGFESIVKKETTTDWDTDIRNMVGAGILTSDADGRKMRKKKIPRKKIKPQNDKTNSEILLYDQKESNNNLNQINKSQIDETTKSNVSENVCSENKQNCIESPNYKKSSKDQNEFSIPLKIRDEVTELCNEQLLVKSSSSKLLKTQNELCISLDTPDKVTELNKEQLPIKSDTLKRFNEQLSIKSNFPSSVNDSELLKTQSEFSISLETPDKITQLFKEQLPIKSDSLKSFNESNFANSLNDSKLFKTQSGFPISLKTPDKVIELYKTKSPIKSDSSKNFNNTKTLEKLIEFPIISLETPDKVTELYKEPLLIKSDSSKSLNDKKQSAELSISTDIPDKITELYSKQSSFESNSLKHSCTIQNNIETSIITIKEQENNLNQLNTLEEINKSTTTFNSKEVTNTNQENKSNFLETLNNLNYLKPLAIDEKPENKSIGPIEHLEKQVLVDINETNNSSILNSPVQVNQPIDVNLIQTPYKCDDAAVDVPETPISKLLREYDPSKLITPLHSTPYHYDDSLTETPLTKVFRETSYLNRPPISPFPPTPGNSRSVDTLIVPLDQECPKTSINIIDKINSLKELFTQPNQTIVNNEHSVKKNKVIVKPSCSINKPKLSTKSKIKTDLKGKTIEAKISQVYESVKVELFGSEISSSLSEDELVKITEQPKKITINKIKEKKSGFKPIPKRKSIEPTPIAINESDMLNELDSKLNKPFIKSTKEHNENNSLEESKNNLKTKQLNKIKKSMVNFDDPVEKSYKLVLSKSNNNIISSNEIPNKNITNEKSENLIGISRYLNKPVKFAKNNSSEIKIKIIEPENNFKLKNSGGSSIKYPKMFNENASKMSSDILNISKTHISNQQNKPYVNCSIDKNEDSDEQINNITLNKSNISMDSKSSIDAETSGQCSISKKMNTNLNKSNPTESTNISCKKSINNISVISINHNDELAPVIKEVDPTNSLEYLKQPKVFEVTTDDSKQVVSLTLF